VGFEGESICPVREALSANEGLVMLKILENGMKGLLVVVVLHVELPQLRRWSLK
jgi:hypothetical protein